MGLRIKVASPETLRVAIKAVATATALPKLVILIWTPDFFSVQSTITSNIPPRRQNFSALLNIPSNGFTSYESTDQYFNAVVEAADLDAIFSTAKSSDSVEFLQSFADNNLDGFGCLHARFGRPVGAHMEDYISLKIYGILPDKLLQSADISIDPSLNPRAPVATFRSRTFSGVIAILETMSQSVKIIVTKGEVNFHHEGEDLNPMVIVAENGLLSTRKDAAIAPIKLKLNLPMQNIHLGANLSVLVDLYKRTEDVVVMRFLLEKDRVLLEGEIIYWMVIY